VLALFVNLRWNYLETVWNLLASVNPCQVNLPPHCSRRSIQIADWEIRLRIALPHSIVTHDAECRAAITRRATKFAADFFAPNRHEIVNSSTILFRARVAPTS